MKKLSLFFSIMIVFVSACVQGQSNLIKKTKFPESATISSKDEFQKFWDAHGLGRFNNSGAQFTSRPITVKNGVLRIPYSPGDYGGAGFRKGATIYQSQPYFESNSAYYEYEFKFGENFDFGKEGEKYRGGKFGVTFTVGKVGVGSAPNPGNFQMTTMWREQGKMDFYFYHSKQGGKWPAKIIYAKVETEKWYKIGFEVILNNPGESDGVVRIYLDDELKYENTELELSKTDKVQFKSTFTNFFGGDSENWRSRTYSNIEYKDISIHISKPSGVINPVPVPPKSDPEPVDSCNTDTVVVEKIVYKTRIDTVFINRTDTLYLNCPDSTILTDTVRVDSLRLLKLIRKNKKEIDSLKKKIEKYHSTSIPDKDTSISDFLADIYVNPSGNDRNIGSKEKPLRTLKAALKIVKPSESISLSGGVFYEGDLTLKKSGSKGKPIVIRGAGQGKTFIRGSKPVSKWISQGGGLWVTLWTVNSQQVFLNGKPLKQIGAKSPWHTKIYDGNPYLPPAGSGIESMKDSSFYHTGASLYIKLPSRINPNNELVEASFYNSVLTGTGSYVELKGITFSHANGSHSGARGKLVDLGKSYWTVDSCTFSYGDFINLYASGINHVIKNSKILYAGNLGIDMNNGPFSYDRPAQNTVVENNEISYNNYRGFYKHWHTGGLKIIPGIRAVIVRDNLVKHNDGPGIWFDRPLGENIIEGNTIIGNLKGIFYEIAEPVSAGNTIKFGAIIRDNIVVNTVQQGIYIAASSDVIVEHNTVVNCWAGIVLHGMPRSFYKVQGNTVRNNIVHGGIIDLVLFVGKNSSNNKLDGNFYVTDFSFKGSKTWDRIRVGTVSGSGYKANKFSIEEMQKRGYEKTGLSGNPGFVDAENLDFRIKKGFPAYGKGVRY